MKAPVPMRSKCKCDFVARLISKPIAFTIVIVLKDDHSGWFVNVMGVRDMEGTLFFLGGEIS